MAGASVNKPSKVYYLPSVSYQLRDKGLELLKCNPDGYCMYSALYKVMGGINDSRGDLNRIRDDLLNIVRNNDDVRTAILVDSRFDSIEDYCRKKQNTTSDDEETWGDSCMLRAWCYSNNCNIRIYSVHNQTQLIQEMIFPETFPVTFRDAEKRGLFLHGNHYDAVMPISGTCGYFIGLWKKFNKHELQECPICFRENVNRSRSHIIPECMLRMVANEFVRENKKISPNKMTEKLLCSSSKRKYAYESMECGCEEMLSSSEEILCDLLAGSSWKKKDGPSEVKGLIEDFREAVNSENNGSVQFTTNMAHRRALISIAYRLLITWRGKFPKKSNNEIKKMEESLGRLAQKLHDLVVFPYASEIVHVLLLFSANGTKAFDSPSPELHISQVVPFEYGSSVDILIHFGLRGLNFIVTDSVLFARSLHISQKFFIISNEEQIFTIPYIREENGPFLSQLIEGYTIHKFDPSAAASSVEIEIPEGSLPRELSDCNIVRLPNGFEYNYVGVTFNEIGKNWTICHEKDMKDGFVVTMNTRLYYCKKMWILSHKYDGLNAVFAFVSDSKKHLVFGFSLSDNHEIIDDPMFQTNFVYLDITPEEEGAYGKAIKDFQESLVMRHWSLCSCNYI